MTNYENWKARPLSYRLGKALMFFDPPTAIWEMAQKLDREFGNDLQESDLPAVLLNLLNKMDLEVQATEITEPGKRQ